MNQAQHDAFGAAPRDGVALRHPHPVPPLDFTAASSAQHALAPAGAGPPQQLPPLVSLGWSVFVCLVFIVVPPVASHDPPPA
jgi:hypothetical protein